jgi:hypothetical protein
MDHPGGRFIARRCASRWLSPLAKRSGDAHDAVRPWWGLFTVPIVSYASAAHKCLVSIDYQQIAHARYPVFCHGYALLLMSG